MNGDAARPFVEAHATSDAASDATISAFLAVLWRTAATLVRLLEKARKPPIGGVEYGPSRRTVTAPSETIASADEAPLPPASPARVALTIATVIGLVTAASYALPADWSAAGVAAVFLIATHVLVLRGDAGVVRRYGLSLGGLLEPEKIDVRRVGRAALRAGLVAVLCFGVVVVPFTAGYKSFNGIHRTFSWSAAFPSVEEAMGQLFVIALPEEAFFRGYVQTRLDVWLPRRISILSLPVGGSIVLTSAIFAVCHLLTIPAPARLAVFFPSLLFGALRAREGGIGACTVLHASFNLLTASLARGFAGPHHP